MELTGLSEGPPASMGDHTNSVGCPVGNEFWTTAALTFMAGALKEIVI